MAQSHGVQISVSEGPAASGDGSEFSVAVRYTVATPFGPKLDRQAVTHRDVTHRLRPETIAEITELYNRLRLALGEQIEAVGAREAAQLHVITTGQLATQELTGAV